MDSDQSSRRGRQRWLTVRRRVPLALLLVVILAVSLGRARPIHAMEGPPSGEVFPDRLSSATDPCPADSLRARIAELDSLVAGLQHDTELTDAFVQRLLSWQSRFSQDYDMWDLESNLGDAGISAGTSVVASMVLTESGVATAAAVAGAAGPAALGAVLGLAAAEANRRMRNVARVWGHADRNSAFFEWIMESSEYGRRNRITADLTAFVDSNADILERVTGAPLPEGTIPLRNYLHRNATTLLYFFGRMEEQIGAERFPRYKLTRAEGKYGHGRWDVGYWRKVLRGKLLEELRYAQREMDRLRRTCPDLLIDDVLGEWETRSGSLTLRFDGQENGMLSAVVVAANEYWSERGWSAGVTVLRDWRLVDPKRTGGRIRLEGGLVFGPPGRVGVWGAHGGISTSTTNEFELAFSANPCCMQFLRRPE